MRTIHDQAASPPDSNARVEHQRTRGVWRLCAGLLLAPLAIAGCSTRLFLTESGPSRGAIVRGASRIVYETTHGSRAQYQVVMVNNAVIREFDHRAVRRPRPPDDGKPAVYRGQIGVGDVIGVTIFEAGSGGLFLPRAGSARPGNYVVLPDQQVDADGDIMVPYAGQVKAVGLLPAELENKIESLLAGRALEPQVVVTIVKRLSDPVTVLGEVAKATSFSLSPAGISLLSAIAKAGGPKYPAYESVVTLQRDGHLWHIRMSDLESNPRLNLPLRPGDTLYVTRQQRYFVAMGAIGQSTSLGPVDRRLAFKSAHLSLMDALGRAGGLNDELANARAIFVYRMGQSAAAGNASRSNSSAAQPTVPTIYLVNLSAPMGFFYASRFPVRPEDVVYVANAPASDLQKFLTLMLGVSASAAYLREAVHPYAGP